MKYLAEQPDHELRGAVSEISSQTGIPLPYLWKVLKDLTESQLLHSFRVCKRGITACQGRPLGAGFLK